MSERYQIMVTTFSHHRQGGSSNSVTVIGFDSFPDACQAVHNINEDKWDPSTMGACYQRAIPLNFKLLP